MAYCRKSVHNFCPFSQQGLICNVKCGNVKCGLENVHINLKMVELIQESLARQEEHSLLNRLFRLPSEGFQNYLREHVIICGIDAEAYREFLFYM